HRMATDQSAWRGRNSLHLYVDLERRHESRLPIIVRRSRVGCLCGADAFGVLRFLQPDALRGGADTTASKDKTARVWDAKTGKPITEPLRHEDQVVSARFAPGGLRVVTASSDKTARVWDA